MAKRNFSEVASLAALKSLAKKNVFFFDITASCAADTAGFCTSSTTRYHPTNKKEKDDGAACTR